MKTRMLVFMFHYKVYRSKSGELHKDYAFTFGVNSYRRRFRGGAPTARPPKITAYVYWQIRILP